MNLLCPAWDKVSKPVGLTWVSGVCCQLHPRSQHLPWRAAEWQMDLEVPHLAEHGAPANTASTVAMSSHGCAAV